jgi:hypothetical protein
MADTVLLSLTASAIGGVLSALLTIALTPRLQHHFWRYQRRTELQLATIREINRLTAEFLVGYISNPTAPPADALFSDLDRARADVGALFSSGAAASVQTVVGMVGPRLGSASGDRMPNDFARAREAAIRALYADVLPSSRSWYRG